MQHGKWLRGAGLAVLACVWLTAAGSGQEYRAGTGRVDITPKGPIWMAGYGNRNKPSEGVDAPLALKALALKGTEGPPLLLITADVIGFPREVTEKIAGRLERELKVPRANVMVVASHTHTGPVIASNLETMFDLHGKDLEAVRAYTEKLPDLALEAAAAAVREMQPVQLSFGRGHASFAVNRRIFRPNGVNFGANLEGPTDHTVSVLRVEDTGGKVRAVVFGYACHCTTLDGDCYRLSGDWAGFAQEFLERAYPGSTALFLTGCGGDANPQPRGTLDLARQHGLEMAGAVSQALHGPRQPIHGRLRAAFDRVELPLARPPSAEEFRRRLNDRDRFVRLHARHQLQVLERDGKLPTSYPCPVQAWQFGRALTLVALGGEVLVDYDRRLKRELGSQNLWVGAYANDVFAYIPSVRVLLEGGYEADYSMIYYGLPTRFSNQVEDTLVGKVHEVVKRVRP